MQILDEIKELFRGHPSIFSTRVIMRQFAYKKFSRENELKNSIKAMIQPKESVKKKRASRAVISAADGVLNKKAIKSELSLYLEKQKLLSEIIKEEIVKAFSELNLI